MLSFLLGVGILLILSKLLFWPLKIILKLIGNALIGGVLLLIFNAFQEELGLVIEITPFTALIVGIFGIPGLLLLLFLS